MTDEKGKSKKKEKKSKRRKVNWREYNESLVRRGEVMFDTAFLENWRAELRAMNRGKEGAKYVYPNSLIWLLATVPLSTHTHTSYRTGSWKDSSA